MAINLKPSSKKEESSPFDEVKQLLVEQVSHEYLNSTKYRHISYECSRLGFHKASKFFLTQANGEIEHADLILEFLKDTNLPFTGFNIEPTDIKLSSLKEAVELALKTEQGTTEKLATIKIKAAKLESAGGELIYTFMLPMIVEQREEEALYKDFLATLTHITTPEGEVLFEHSYFE